MGTAGVDIMHLLCTKVWNSGIWPDDWKESIFTPILKKGSPTECNNYRTLSLISHASKVLLNITHRRLKPFLMPQIAEEQAGFVPGKGTREQILNVRQLIEKVREFNVPMILCFVDYSKAFDKVRWNQLWEILQEMGVPKHLVALIESLYEGNTARVKIGNTYSGTFQTQAGVRQGCTLSPVLFNIYSEHIMRKVLDKWKGGISIGGQKISNLRYADDTLIIAEDTEQIAVIMK